MHTSLRPIAGSESRGVFRPLPGLTVNATDTFEDQLIDAYLSGKKQQTKEFSQQIDALREAKFKRATQHVDTLTDLLFIVLSMVESRYDAQHVKRVYADFSHNPFFRVLLFVDHDFFFSESALDLIEMVTDIQQSFCVEYQIEIEFNFAVETGATVQSALRADGYTNVLDFGLETSTTVFNA